LQSLTDSIRNSGVLEIQDRMASISGGRVLDVGTQHGSFITVMMKSMKDYKAFVGIDISEEDLEKARDAIKDDSVDFELMNAEEISFDDNSFDTVCLSFSLHHLSNVGIVLREMLRVLKPGGHLILQEMYSDGDQGAAQLAEIRTHHLGAKVDRIEGIPHYETLTRQQLKDAVNELGFSNVEVYETTWSLKCLYCDNLHQCEDPRSDYNIKFGREEVQGVLDRAMNHPDTEDIQQEARLLLDNMERTGYQSASLLFLICRK
jgi:ubiquinone/menaquinone biosynthesis C-methylase UbiE